MATSTFTETTVDSGRLLIVDPIYLENYLTEEGKAVLQRAMKAMDNGNAVWQADLPAAGPLATAALIETDGDGTVTVDKTDDGEFTVTVSDE